MAAIIVVAVEPLFSTVIVWPAGSLVDVWVLAGQSNCVGTNFEDGQSMPAAAAPMPGQILCFDSSGRSVRLGVGEGGQLSLAKYSVLCFISKGGGAGEHRQLILRTCSSMCQSQPHKHVCRMLQTL
jgi:hypothetical protein